MHRFPIREHDKGVPDLEDEAILSSRDCTPGPHSSPTFYSMLQHNLPRDVPILALDGLFTDDSSDIDYIEEQPRRHALTDTEKTIATLDLIRDNFSRFSIKQFLETLFTSNDPRITNRSNMYLADEGHLRLMGIWWDKWGGLNSNMSDWIIEKASDLCSKEASMLSERASTGPHQADVAFLRVPASQVGVDFVNKFSIYDLATRYERITPNIQKILKGFIGKEDRITKDGVRDPRAGRAMITSILLNLRSRRLNYHQIVNSLIFWDNRVPKRLLQAFNHFAITSSYPSQARAVMALSRDSLRLARLAANDPTKVTLLPYDNFNWTARAWESTALHHSITHDEVSALLVVLQMPDGPDVPSAEQLTSVSRFSETEGTRHRIPNHQSLSEILPTASDQTAFRTNAIVHVLQILCSEIKAFNIHKQCIPAIKDTLAIVPQKTEEYFLPTFDQEQGSTRGNMVVLLHYFGKVLCIPPTIFETKMHTVLGDRLTTVRDRAAQDQRAVDRSTAAFDHLSSIRVVSGLMHFCMNFIHAIGQNAWGSTESTNPVSLLCLRDILPNRQDLINLRKLDFYAWLRFLDAVQHGLVIKAAMSILQISSAEIFLQKIKTYNDLVQLATQVVDSFLLPSVDRLEATKVKSLKGNTQCGHAVLLMHDLMTLREMRDGIRNGHPTRITRMIKWWLPMFYAGGSYNYANECMELLHNIIHDWPRDYATVAFNGMLVNPSGQPGKFKETDLRVEHLNDVIKERTHGSNATPEVLEKTTPALGHVRRLTDILFDELGVEYQNQRHAEVGQRKDIEIIVEHLTKHAIFNFEEDKLSNHAVIDLFRTGASRLAGPNGGHAKHLARHILRSRTRHTTIESTETIDDHIFLNADLGGEQVLHSKDKNELADIVTCADSRRHDSDDEES
ncbi:hypothetical protein H0H93_015957 [Arthromyces matolae]|nr:hypothetical protein H0H93_015957 [Arthromyces matolae]